MAEVDVEAGAAKAPPVDPATLPLVLVLLGRVGAGKSSTANTLLALPEGRRFEARHAAAAVTSACRAELGVIDGREVMVLDTPGFSDLTTSAQEVFLEIRRGLTELAPAGALVCPLVVLGLQSRVSEDDYVMIEGLTQNIFGASMLTTAVVVWTHADALDESAGLEGYLADSSVQLRELLASFRGGSVCLNNRLAPPTDGSSAPQVEALLRQAAGVAQVCRMVRMRDKRMYGRKSARRQRQIEAGLLKSHVSQPGTQEAGAAGGQGGCIIA